MSWRYSMVALASTTLFACHKPVERETAQQPSSEPASVLPPLPVADPPLNREALLMAAIRAASAAAAGKKDNEAQRLLDGKRFEMRLRFGCGGFRKDSDAPRSWTFDEERRVLRIRVESDISADTSLLSELGMEQFEAADGFWIERPWLLTADCPAEPAGSSDAPPATRAAEEAPAASPPDPRSAQSSARPRLAMVQFFTASDSRTHRRDRAYEVTRTLGSGAEPGGQGFNLIVAGRLKRQDGHPVIACISENPGQAPSCVISAEFDRVAVEHPGTGEILADWAGR